MKITFLVWKNYTESLPMCARQSVTIVWVLGNVDSRCQVSATFWNILALFFQYLLGLQIVCLPCGKNSLHILLVTSKIWTLLSSSPKYLQMPELKETTYVFASSICLKRCDKFRNFSLLSCLLPFWWSETNVSWNRLMTNGWKKIRQI